MTTVFGNDKNMNGVINVYKEKGYTSHDVVAKLRGILKIKKTGHTGTLDPDAQGVLPVCIGNATKLCDFIMEKNKEYDAELILGKKTDTLDSSGRIIEVSDHYRYLTRQEVEQCINGFVGEYKQIPPMYSAIKVNGKKLYELARQGIEIERKARNVTIRGIDIISFDMPVIRIKVKCSRGTYIRTLCNDIGDRLSTYGCMGNLVRTKSGRFKIEDSIKLSEIENHMKNHTLQEILIPTDEVLSEFESLLIDEKYNKLLMNGNTLEKKMFRFCDAAELEDGKMFKVYDGNNHFKAVYRYVKKDNLFKNEKMF